MSSPNKASYEYLRSAVLTASPEQLQLMLLDGAIRFALRGREAIERNDYEASFNALERAQRIVIELINGMNREVNPSLVDQMMSLYNFIFRRLVDGNLNRDVKAIDEALRILRHQRETWALLIEKIVRETGAPQRTPSAPPAGGEPRPSLVVEG
jgi:flagellar protein FliS